MTPVGVLQCKHLCKVLSTMLHFSPEQDQHIREHVARTNWFW
jgi:hypothetical protein